MVERLTMKNELACGVVIPEGTSAGIPQSVLQLGWMNSENFRKLCALNGSMCLTYMFA
jgi:hypothetical protein